MCTAPQNNKKLTETPKYTGVGGHLFSIANLGAEPICMLHQFHFGIFEDKMKKIMEVYTYEWTDEQL